MKNRKYFLADLILGSMCVIVVGALVFAISMFREEYSYHYSEDSLYYRLEEEDFGSLVEMYYANEAAGVKADEDMKEYYGVARYFEAASYHKLYAEAQDAAKAEHYRMQMKEAKKQMGALSFLDQKILEKLGIEE